MTMNFKKLMAGTCLTLALGAFSIGDARALDVGVGSKNTTGVSTGVSTSQNSGVELGTGTRINGGIRTGSNISDTTVGTDVDSSSSAEADIRGGGRHDRDDDANVSSSNTTGVNTGVSTSQNSGVYVPEGTRVNGGIRTGANVSSTGVSTDVDSDSRARLSTASSRGEDIRMNDENRHRGWWQGRREGNNNDRDGDSHND